jgi:dipeptidyl aminopeptidase/acylaminoacyl peptidase
MAALVVAVLKPAEASFPGRNGDIVFIKEKEGNTTTGYEQAIHRMKPDGTNVRKIYYVPEYNTEPAWSADGTKIAFEHADVSVQVDHDIWLMDAGGSDAINLTQKDAIDSRWPAWFPSGRKIVFSSDWDAPNHNYYLYIVSRLIPQETLTGRRPESRAATPSRSTISPPPFPLTVRRLPFLAPAMEKMTGRFT